MLNILNTAFNSTVAVFLAACFVSYAAFTYGASSLDGIRENNKILIAIFSVLNGVLAALCTPFICVYVDFSWYIILLSLILALEFRIFSKDTIYIYSYLMSGAIFVLSISYSFSLALTAFLNFNNHLLIAHSLVKEICTLTYLLAGAYILWLYYTPFIELSNFKALIHSKQYGRFLFRFFIAFDVVTLITMYYIHHYTHLGLANSIYYDFILGIIFVKDLMTLVLSFFIVYSQCRLGLSNFQREELLNEIVRSRQARSATHTGAFFEYVVNITKNTFLLGGEYFMPKDGRQLSYTESLRYLLDHCAHPEDVALLAEQRFGDIRFYQQKLKFSPYYTFVVRLAPKKVLDNIQVPPGTVPHLLSHKQEWFYTSITCSLVLEEKTGDILLYGELSDIDQQMKKEQHLLANANRDGLTNLLNRSAMEVEIGLALDNQEVGVLFLLDRDNFKAVNDVFGHPEGDKLLIETADLITSEFRSNDLVGRLGGDEFIIFAEGLDRPELIIQKAETLISKLKKEYQAPNNTTISTTMSIGIAISNPQGDTYENLYKNADKALYEAKNKGKNTFSIYQDD